MAGYFVPQSAGLQSIQSIWAIHLQVAEFGKSCTVLRENFHILV